MTDKTPMHSPLYRNFIDPNLCVQLLRAGLLAKSSFLWVYAGKGKVQLYCNSLDPDGVYSQAISNIAFVDDETANPYAAFQIGDMLPVMPDFAMDKFGDKYCIMVDTLWKIEPVCAERLPDAFAKMVLELIHAKRIDIKTAIKLINQ